MLVLKVLVGLHRLIQFYSGLFSSGGPRVRFLTRYDGEVSEPLVGRQGSRVSMRVARGSDDGKEIRPTSPQDAYTMGISTVYQEINLCPNLTVAENIFVGRQPMKRGMINWKEINTRARELMSRFHMDIDVTRPLNNYSTAIQQMVSIARAVDIDAKVLILDEPTSSLDDNEVKLLFDVMNELKAEGMGIIFITHFLDQVFAVCDRQIGRAHV